MTLENQPKNEGIRAKSLFWWYFYQNLKKSKTPGWRPLEPFLGHPNGTNGHPWRSLRDFCNKIFRWSQYQISALTIRKCYCLTVRVPQRLLTVLCISADPAQDTAHSCIDPGVVRVGLPKLTTPIWVILSRNIADKVVLTWEIWIYSPSILRGKERSTRISLARVLAILSRTNVVSTNKN